MAKFKKTASKKTAGSRASADDLQAQAEKLSKTLSESAQQIWLAGVGAFGRAQAEGTKLFEGLVKEGLNLEQTARKFADHRGNAVRDVVENRVDQARERATDTWDRSEEHTSELQSLMRISYAVFCLKKKKQKTTTHNIDNTYQQSIQR